MGRMQSAREKDPKKFVSVTSLFPGGEGGALLSEFVRPVDKTRAIG